LYKIRSISIQDSYKQVGAYAITGSLCKAISFAALPFFVNILSEGDIGILNIFNNCLVFLTPIVSMGVLYSISVDYFKLPAQRYAQVFSTGLLIPLVLCCLLFPVLYLLQPSLEAAFNFQPQFVWLIPCALLFNFYFEAFIILIRNQNRTRLFASVSILKILLEISLSVGFIVFIFKSWSSRALGFLAALVLVSGIFYHHIRKNGLLVKSIDFQVVKKELYFGLSGMVLQTAIFFIGSSDKFFVMAFFGKVEAGYYAVASTFATIQYIICISLLQYLQPVLFRQFAASQKWGSLKNFYFKYLGAMLITLVGVVAFAILVYNYLLKPGYKEHLSYFFLLSLGCFVWTISNIFLQYIVFTKNRKLILMLSVAAITIAGLVNYCCSKYLDIYWLGGGQLLINLLVLLIILFINKRLKYFA
jgi:O-antigen/teichoic acid export membrane protein